jgi:hypothetical protein
MFGVNPFCWPFFAEAYAGSINADVLDNVAVSTPSIYGKKDWPAARALRLLDNISVVPPVLASRDLRILDNIIPSIPLQARALRLLDYVLAPSEPLSYSSEIGHGSFGVVATSTTRVITVPSTVTAKTGLVLAMFHNGNNNVTGVTDSRGNTWIVDRTNNGSGKAAALASCAMTTAALQSGDTITVTYSASITQEVSWVLVNTSVPVTADAWDNGSSGGTATSTSTIGRSGGNNFISAQPELVFIASSASQVQTIRTSLPSTLIETFANGGLNCSMAYDTLTAPATNDSEGFDLAVSGSATNVLVTYYATPTFLVDITDVRGYSSQQIAESIGSPVGIADTLNVNSVLPVLDNFNRANEAPLSQGGNWIRMANGMAQLQVVSNAAAGPTTSTTSSMAYTPPGIMVDSESSCSIAILPSITNDSIQVYTRLGGLNVLANTVRGYMAQWLAGSGIVNIVRHNGDNTATTIATATIAAPRVGDKIRITSIGSLHTAYVDTGGGWTSVVSVTDTNYTSGYIGLGGRGTTFAADNFGGGANLNNPQVNEGAGDKNLRSTQATTQAIDEVIRLNTVADVLTNRGYNFVNHASHGLGVDEVFGIDISEPETLTNVPRRAVIVPTVLNTAHISGTTYSVTIPSTVNLNDVLVVAMAVQLTTVTTPSGWTRDIDHLAGSGSSILYVYHKVVVQADLGSTVSFVAGASGAIQGSLTSLHGASNNIELTVTNSANSNPIAVNFGVTQNDGDIALFFPMSDQTNIGGAGWTVPSGFTQLFQTANGGANTPNLGGFYRVCTDVFNIGSVSSTDTGSGSVKIAAGMIVIAGRFDLQTIIESTVNDLKSSAISVQGISESYGNLTVDTLDTLGTASFDVQTDAEADALNIRNISTSTQKLSEAYPSTTETVTQQQTSTQSLLELFPIIFIAETHGTQNASSGTTFVINKPAGVIKGDTVLIFIASQTSATPTVTDFPSGFQLIDRNFVVGTMRFYVYRRVIDGSEGSSFNFTQTSTLGLKDAYIAVAYRNGHPILDANAMGAAANPAGAPAIYTTPSVVASVVNDMCVTAFMQVSSVNAPRTWTTQSGQTERADVNPSLAMPSLASYDDIEASSGSISGKSASVDNSQTTSPADGWIGLLKPGVYVEIDSVVSTGTSSQTMNEGTVIDTLLQQQTSTQTILEPNSNIEILVNRMICRLAIADNLETFKNQAINTPSLFEPQNWLVNKGFNTPSITEILITPGSGFNENITNRATLTSRISEIMDGSIYLVDDLTNHQTNKPRIVERIINPFTLGVGPGNGGEVTLVQLAPAGTRVTHSLAANINASSGAIELDSVVGLPDGSFVIKIDDEVIYVSYISGNVLAGLARGVSGTTPASHGVHSLAYWDDVYDMSVTSQYGIACAIINEVLGAFFTQPGYIIPVDCSQAYKPNGNRYATHVSEILGVWSPGDVINDTTSKLDHAQPNIVASVTGATDLCPVAMTIPARIRSDILVGDFVLLRYRNTEPYILTLGPRSCVIQSWYEFRRVDTSNHDLTVISPVDGHVVSSDPDGEIVDGATAANFVSSGPQLITALLPGNERFFTFGSPGYSDTAWVIAGLAIRQGYKRIPLWTSPNWHNFSWIYCGFGEDCNFVQLLCDRNSDLGLDPYHLVGHMPGPGDFYGPNVTWEENPDYDYYTSTAWMVVIKGFEDTPFIFGPAFAGDYVSRVSNGGPTDVTIYPPQGGITELPPGFEGGSGGNIDQPTQSFAMDGMHFQATETVHASAKDSGAMSLAQVGYRAIPSANLASDPVAGSFDMESLSFRADTPIGSIPPPPGHFLETAASFSALGEYTGFGNLTDFYFSIDVLFKTTLFDGGIAAFLHTQHGPITDGNPLPFGSNPNIDYPFAIYNVNGGIEMLFDTHFAQWSVGLLQWDIGFLPNCTWNTLELHVSKGGAGPHGGDLWTFQGRLNGGNWGHNSGNPTTLELSGNLHIDELIYGAIQSGGSPSQFFDNVKMGTSWGASDIYGQDFEGVDPIGDTDWSAGSLSITSVTGC